ncbi:MAG: hypothetical protein ABI193_00990 [Minicystis sp.]
MSAITAAIHPERLEAALQPWVPDAEDRAFVVRCILGEGPMHHRGASFAILGVLAILVEAAGPAAASATGDTIPVPLRVPPHLARREGDDHVYPLALPTAPLERLAAKGTPELAALVDCLLDGPPHHALANAATMCLLEALLAKLGRKGG